MTLDDVWVSLEEAVEKLKPLSLEDIELMITGMSEIAIRRNNGKLVNLKGIGDYLQKMQIIANKLISPATSPSEKDSSPGKEVVWIKGRVAAQRMSMEYESFLGLCEKEEIKAERKTRGWRIEESVLNEFIKLNQELIKSLKKIRKRMTPKVSIPKPVNPPLIDHLPVDSKNPTATDSSSISNEETTAIEEEKQSENDSVAENQDADDLKNDESQEKPSIKEVKHFSVRARKYNGGYYCWSEDVARSIHMPESTVRKWITDKKVKSIEKVESSGVAWFIEHESLRTFVEEYNISLTFDKN